MAFDRLDVGARAALLAGEREAAALGDAVYGSAHLLLGILADPDAVGAVRLRDAGITATEVRRRALESTGRSATGAIGPEEALQSIGIDYAEVRRAVEAEFGEGALGGVAGLGRRLPFTPSTKKILELSLRESLAARSRTITVDHLVLAVLRHSKSLAATVIRDAGVDTSAIQSALRDHVRKVG